jgi:hypothetical protein
MAKLWQNTQNPPKYRQFLHETPEFAHIWRYLRLKPPPPLMLILQTCKIDPFWLNVLFTDILCDLEYLSTVFCTILNICLLYSVRS